MAQARTTSRGGGDDANIGGGTRVRVESLWASFDLGGTKGDFLGVAARGDLRLSRIVGFRIEAPVYTLHLDGQSTVTGVGDIELRTRMLLYDAHDWRLSAGFSDQLPTGKANLGVGQGANQLTPFATGGYRSGRLVVYGLVADAIVIRARDAATPNVIDYVDPSSDHELRYTLGTVIDVSKSFYANLAVTGITVLVPSEVGRTLATGGGSVGIVPSARWKLVVGLQLPLAGERRFDERVLFGAYYTF